VSYLQVLQVSREHVEHEDRLESKSKSEDSSDKFELKLEKSLTIFLLPHFGHLITSSELDDNINSSKTLLHFLHLYSNIGIIAIAPFEKLIQQNINKKL
jgi:hypothetical protein